LNKTAGVNEICCTPGNRGEYGQQEEHKISRFHSSGLIEGHHAHQSNSEPAEGAKYQLRI